VLVAKGMLSAELQLLLLTWSAGCLFAVSKGQGLLLVLLVASLLLLLVDLRGVACGGLLIGSGGGAAAGPASGGAVQTGLPCPEAEMGSWFRVHDLRALGSRWCRRNSGPTMMRYRSQAARN
jgi:hypothetical protein